MSDRPQQDAPLGSCIGGLQSGGGVRVNCREGSRGGVSLEGDEMQRECTLGWGWGAHGCIPAVGLADLATGLLRKGPMSGYQFPGTRSRRVDRFAGCKARWAP